MSMFIKPNILDDINLEKELRIEKYAYILKNIHSVDVTKSLEFQKNYNSFFRVRRNEKWREIYYELMEKAKKNDLSFADVLYEIYNKTGRIEASFSSKLINCINPDKPIWDGFVLKNLNIIPREKEAQKRLKEAEYIYNCLEKQINCFLKTEDAKLYIEKFDKMLPQYTWISDVKKIDFLIWKTR